MLSRAFQLTSRTIKPFGRVNTLFQSNSRAASSFTTVDDDFNLDDLEIQRNTEELLVEQPWTTRPFIVDQKLQLPVYNLINGEFTGELCNFDQKYFNLPLRRDIVARSFHYFSVKGKVRTKMVLRVGDVAGSGKKPVPQKGRGASRQGNKRAPQRRGGGKAMGPVPQDLTEKLPVKVRIKALQTALSAKLYENKIVMIDTEEMEYGRTNYVSEILKPFGIDRLCFLTPSTMDNNFRLACQNLNNVRTKRPQQFNVTDLVTSDICFFTKQGLIELEEIIGSRIMNNYRNKKVPRDFELPSLKYIPTYAPKSRKDPEWTDIIKPTLQNEQLQEELIEATSQDNDKDLHIFTPSVYKYMKELKDIQNKATEEKEEEPAKTVQEGQ